MSDNGASAFPAQLALTCGFCDDSNDLIWFCKSCAESLCNTCKISHPTIPMFKKHVVVPRTNDVMRLYGPSKFAVQCQIHPEKEISTYCNECHFQCCATCQVQNHKRHDISTIEEKYLSAENDLNDRAKELERDVIPTLDKMTEKSKKAQSERRVNTDRVKEEVNTFRKELKKAVDDSCDDLIEKLDQNDIEFDNMIAKLDAKKSEALALIKEINKIIQKGDLSMIKYSPPSPGTLIPEVPTLNVTIPVFTPGRDVLTTIQKKIGTVEWIDRNSTSDRMPSLKTTFDPSMIKINKVMSFNSEIPITSITTADNNTAWVMYCYRETMYLYYSSGGLVRSITVEGSKGINDTVIRRSGEMIVTCGDGTVRRVSVSGEVSTLIDTSPFYPEGVGLTDSEDVVLFLSGKRGSNHVAVYSYDTGMKLREIRGINCQGKQHIIDPYRVVCNGKYLFVVDIFSPRNVVCVDEKGDVRWVYEGKEAKLSKLFIPRGISVDRYNNLLVTDTNNHCVHYIDRKGRLIQIILTQEQTGLSGHWGICVDDNTGQVWVGNNSGNVVISKYLSLYKHECF